ncbi:deoxynucleotidyltransferase terminal-interacting protein 2 isoform X3 [Dipodomys spectabilis]|uniref:deoxynucleotidyltransferase terminal-interacting protein 2 isoform X2 n=1 Tax=Dipodomys spectabilis TaxID=105255 RepID=UPI001C53CE2B|nr:deoxynucleotidyltransferase terminal-interacting protein 2 isoform X2 [Dipodomys spectabilis]XP_042535352.1 deoxynucleotidyltransferase terminal-interacting protein 2 isoform X3 [Dipodomys spectabilis]
MVLTRSSRREAGVSGPSAGGSRQKSSAAEEIQAHAKRRKEPSYDGLTAEVTKSAGKQSSSNRNRQNKTSGLQTEVIELSTDGETSEAESNCSSVFEVQEPIVRITRRRQIIIASSPGSSVRKRKKIASIKVPLTEEIVSDTESPASSTSSIVPSTEIRAKSRIDPSQEAHTGAVSDAESSCSDILFSGNIPRTAIKNMQRNLQVQIEKKDTKTVSQSEKQIMDTSMSSEDLDTKNLNEADIVVIDDEKEINKKISQMKNLSNLQKTSLQQLSSQMHSSPSKNKTIVKPSNQNCEAIMKSLAQKFAVVEVDRWNEGKKGNIKGSDLTTFSDLGGSDKDEEVIGVDGGGAGKEDELTIVDVSEDKNSKGDVDFECDTTLCNSELNTSPDIGDSVLLVLSSDESQQSESSDNEEDTLCFVDNCDQKESPSGDSKNLSCDNALFVIDTTPGLSADKKFYLEEEEKASEIATEEEKEEQEEDEGSEESSDSDKNKDDEFSDEDDLLNNTKSKLLKLTSSSIDPGLSIKQMGGLYINFNADKLQSKKTLTQIKEKKKNELLQKAIITPDFEQKHCVAPYRESKHQLQKKRRKERQKTAGDGWFGMKAPELTEELKNDLKALKMRASMDPKRFYKKNDRDGFPKYFQIGTIVDNPADFYHSRIPKKQRKRTIVEELLADSEFRRYNRRKYSEIMAEKAASAAGKRFRKKKKFRN